MTDMPMIWRMDDGGGGVGFFLPVIGFAVVGFALVIGLALLASARDRTRVAALRAWALSRDFTYQPRDDALGRVYGVLPYEGHGRVDFENVLRGRVSGRPVELFDYTYRKRGTTTTTDANGVGRSSSTTTPAHVRALGVQLPSRFPDITVGPRGFFSRVAVALGGQDVEIGDPQFDRAFRVKADDDAGARAFLRPLAAGLARTRDQVLQVRGDQLVLHREGTLQAADLDDWLALVRDDLDGALRA